MIKNINGSGPENAATSPADTAASDLSGGRLVDIDAVYPAGFTSPSDADDSAPRSAGGDSDNSASAARYADARAGSLYHFTVGGVPSSGNIATPPGTTNVSEALTVADGSTVDPGAPGAELSALGAAGGGSGGSGSVGSAALAVSTTQVGTSSGFVFNITFDSSVAGAPAGFTAAIVNAAQLYASSFSSPVTINLDVGWGEIDGQSLSSGALGESETYLDSYSYSQLRASLTANATSPDQQSAVGTLPTTSPVSGSSFSVATAEAKALGLIGASSSLDGYVGFGSNSAYTFDPNNRAVSGEYDFIGVAEHEISEVMGRDAYLGGQGFGYSPLDLFRYSSPGTRQLTGGRTSYLSINGGATNLDNFNINSGGDYGDWASSAGNDAYDAFSNSGVANVVSATDLREMNVLGYTLTGSGTPSPSPSTPTPAPTPAQTPPPNVSSSLEFLATGDVNGDGLGDAAFTSGGQAVVWLNQSGSGFTAYLIAGAHMGSAWTAYGTADFNGDGKSDLLWTNASGQTAIWELNGANLLQAAAPAGQMGSAWHVAGTGDFTGNGDSDILWANASGQAAVWLMNGASLVGSGVVDGQMGPGWTIVGTGDFYGNGHKDALWESNTGQVAIWGLSGTSLYGLNSNLGQTGTNWHVAGVGNFNGDNTQDIVWVDNNNDVQVWNIEAGQFKTTVALSGHDGPEWHLAGIGNFSGDGNHDLLWLTGSGTAQIWQVNGSQVTVAQPFSPSNEVLLGL